MAKKQQPSTDVKVHHAKNGCGLDGRKDPHTHTQQAWRKHIDDTPMPGRKTGR